MSERVQRATVRDRTVEVVATDVGLDLDGDVVSWLEVDDLVEGDHRLDLVLADGRTVSLEALGATHDRFLTEVRTARRNLRFPNLALTTGTPLLTVTSRAPDGWADVHVYDRTVVVEPRSGPPVPVPLALVERLRRDGHTLTFECRGIGDVVVRALGASTDEFVATVERAARALREATSAAFATFDERLSGFAAPDGWALDRAAADRWWAPLEAAALGGSRSEEMATLAGLAGDRLALGLHTDGGSTVMPFALAPVGGRIVVEAVDADDRATFVFATDDLARLNAVLILTGFRRDVLALPEPELGRWAVAVRTSPHVQWARSALVARVVHTASWSDGIRSALDGPSAG